MIELVDIAKIWKKKSAEAIYPGLDSVLSKFTGKRSIKNFKNSTAFKTGNLLRKFVQSNADNDILATKIISNQFFRYEMILNIAPTGAEYGKYVHNGTSKMGERPFARIGAEQPQVINTINEFTKGMAATQAQKYNDILKPIFEKMGKP